MTPCEQFIQKIADILPETCSSRDLVDAGLFTSPQAAAYYRTCGGGPSFFKLGIRIIYPREAVLEWLRGQKHECSDATIATKNSSKITSLPMSSGMENDRGA